MHTLHCESKVNKNQEKFIQNSTFQTTFVIIQSKGVLPTYVNCEQTLVHKVLTMTVNEVHTYISQRYLL